MQRLSPLKIIKIFCIGSLTCFLYLPQLKEAVYFILVIIYVIMVIYIVLYAKYWENSEVPSKGNFTENTCHLTPDESLVFTCNQESSNR